MARISPIIAAMLSSLVVPLLDAATKGVFVLFVAGLICIFLRRDSAATRHCVLSVAVCMLLLLPILSLLLPQWQLLPNWMVPSASLVKSAELDNQTSQQFMNAQASGVFSAQINDEAPVNSPNRDRSGIRTEMLPSLELDTDHEPVRPAEIQQTSGSERQAAETGVPVAWMQPASLAQNVAVIWALGVIVLLLRLILSAGGLRRSERRCANGNVVLGEQLNRAVRMIGLKRSVRLLLDPDQSIPIVWGVFQPRLRLPAESVNWPHEQLQSVLLHELAHLKRHDLLELSLTQLVCSLHWFNPLVWLTAWRLHVERERACDDLVLASGIRPSAYAEHLLQVAMNLAGSRWTQACGLAMARRSSLEGRLVAVLSQKLNRRGTTLALMSVVILCGASITTPVAMLAALRAPEAMPALNQEAAVEEQPLHESAQELLTLWQKRARTDGKIPGALIGQLGQKVDDFIRLYPVDPGSRKLFELRGRFDANRDWTVEELRTLLDAVAACATAPLGWTSLPMEFEDFRTIKPGSPLPAELRSAAWGPPAANGLRAAWLLEPQSEQYALNTVLKVRVLFHNAGDVPVIFCTETWHQSDKLDVQNQKNEDITTSSTFYTGITPLANFRLLPGEYCEVGAPGVAIGTGEYRDEYSTGKLGTVIQANEGDEVSLSCTVDAARGIRFSRPDDPEDPTEQWKMRTAERIASEAPLPTSMADREQLIRRVMVDLTGELPTSEEVAEFVNDPSPDALTTLTNRIQKKSATLPWTGQLTTGTTRFRVIAADPNAATAPRSASSPGSYVLDDGTMLLVRQTATAAVRENKASIVFLSPDPSVASPHKEYSISLPDGVGTYGIVWQRGAGELWVQQKEHVRCYRFSNPADVIETRFEPGDINSVPEALRETLQQAFPSGKVTVSGAVIDEAIEAQLDWGDAVNGLRGAVIIRSPNNDGKEQISLALQNVSDRPLKFSDVTKAQRLRSLYVSDIQGTLFALSSSDPTMTRVTLQPREVVYLAMMPATRESEGDSDVTPGLIEGLRKDSLQTWRIVLDQSFSTRDGSWTGRLVTGETRGVIREGMQQPADAIGRSLFKEWLNTARLNGDIPGGLVQILHEKVNEFIRNNEPDAAGGPFAKKMRAVEPRFANTNDWNPSDVVKLMDDIAAVSSIPLETTLLHLQQRTLKPGTKLPAALEDADWGPPLSSGLRMAYVLEPRSAAFPLGTEVRARILVHNSGSEPVTFITNSFQQPQHTAKLSDGTSLTIDSTHWLTLGRMVAYRLAPGEYCEINTPGLGIGAQVKDREDWANIRAGSWILCSEGNEVIFTPGPAELSYRRESTPGDDWWIEFITERLSRELPFPADTREREYLLYRVVRELYGAAPSTTEGDAFATDQSPGALRNLAELLAKHPYGKRSAGLIEAGSTTIKVLPPDTEADRRPRIATGPGWYSLSDNIKLSINRQAAGTYVRNDAAIIYFREGEDNVHHKILLPDGHDTWTVATKKEATEFWIAEPGVLRKIDFGNPLAPSESRYEGDRLNDAPIPAELRKQLQRILEK